MNIGAETLTSKLVKMRQTGGDSVRYTKSRCDAKISAYSEIKDSHLSDNKQEESFRVIDRRPFTAEGELRQEVVEQEQRDAAREAAIEAAAQKTAPKPDASKSEDAEEAIVPPEDAPKRIPAFENLVRMLGSNAAMVLGAYADPRTGQPMIDPDAARELIDMLDALREKTLGNLAPEEDTLLLDLLGKLKMTYLEVNQAIAAQAQAQAQAKAKTR
jgi:Domain of unknown function (DUF1844)